MPNIEKNYELQQWHFKISIPKECKNGNTDRKEVKGTELTQLMENVTIALRIVCLNPTLGVEIT